MKDKDKKLLSFKESWQTNLRAIKLFWHISPKGMLYRTLDTVWSALTPYAGIWLSALIIEELAGSRSPQRLRILILAALICAAFFSLISALLNKVRQAEGNVQFFQMDYLLSAKMLELDYHISDDPETRKLLSTIRQNMRGGGWGIQRVPNNFCSLLEAVFSLLGGLALTISLFISKVPKEAGSHPQQPAAHPAVSGRYPHGHRALLLPLHQGGQLPRAKLRYSQSQQSAVWLFRLSGTKQETGCRHTHLSAGSDLQEIQ